MDRIELGRLLQAARADIEPAEVGLPTGERRRVNPTSCVTTTIVMPESRELAHLSSAQ